MTLPLSPPIPPQLAKSAKKLPLGPEWSYEPKWDGFRAIVFVDGDDIYLQSRNGKPLRRYFPELKFPEGRYILDGEIVLFDSEGRQDFDALGQRVHPAESRIKMLSEETPTEFIAFDLLTQDDNELLARPQHERRELLEQLAPGKLRLTPRMTEPADAEPWLHKGEGVVAKLIDSPYLPGERKGMVKIKRVRTLDAVVIGWRPGKKESTVGSLILALYGEDEKLRPVGHCSGLSAKEKRDLVDLLAPYETGERGEGEPSRWSHGRDLGWVELRPELVIEVSYDHSSNNRIRHGTTLLRWRTDKDPRDCTIDQLE